MSAGGYGAFNIGFAQPPALRRGAVLERLLRRHQPERGPRPQPRPGAGQRGRHRPPGDRRSRQQLQSWPTLIAFYVGRQDTRFLTMNEQFNAALSHSGIAHTFHTYPGGHSATLWHAQAPTWLGWALGYLADAQRRRGQLTSACVPRGLSGNSAALGRRTSGLARMGPSRPSPHLRARCAPTAVAGGCARRVGGRRSVSESSKNSGLSRRRRPGVEFVPNPIPPVRFGTKAPLSSTSVPNHQGRKVICHESHPRRRRRVLPIHPRRTLIALTDPTRDRARRGCPPNDRGGGPWRVPSGLRPDSLLTAARPARTASRPHVRVDRPTPDGPLRLPPDPARRQQGAAAAAQQLPPARCETARAALMICRPPRRRWRRGWP